MVERREGRVFTSHTNFYLVPGPERPPAWPSSLTTGLVSANGDVVCVTTGTHTGNVALVTEAYDQEPSLESGWEDVAEVSVAVPSGELHVLESQIPFLFGNLALSGPGAYRVRVHANDRGDERAGRGSNDSYLVQVWPAPLADERLIRLCEESRRDLEATERARREPLPNVPLPPNLPSLPSAPQPVPVPGGPGTPIS